MLPYDDWLPLAEQLKEGQKRRVPHECGEGKVMIIEHKAEGYSAYCHRCVDKGWKPHGRRSLEKQLQTYKERNSDIAFTNIIQLPADFSTTIDPAGLRWLGAGGITNHLIDKYGIGYSDYYGRVILPVYMDGKLVYYQARAVHKNQSPKYLNPIADKGAIRFVAGQGRVVVVTEDILSAIRVGEVTGYTGSALLGTSASTADINYLNSFDVIMVWTDPDEAGRKAAKKIVRSMSLLGRTVIDIQTDVDPKILPHRIITEVLNERRTTRAVKV